MKRGMLVEDHDLFRQVLAVILQQHTDLEENVQVGTLAQAREVLDTLGGELLDLAIVDLDLPEGTDLIEDLRELEVPVLASTAYRSPQRRAQALRAGAKEVLPTTTSGEKIVRVVKQLLASGSG